MNPSPRPLIPVEPAFNAVVSRLGGRRVDEVVGKSPPFSNADYVFKADGCVAELKTLEKDQMKEFPREFSALISGWISTGVIPPLPPGRSTVNSEALPFDCQVQIANLYLKPMLGVIEKANKQIRETKRHLKMPDASGLLLLVNDGNTLLEFKNAMYTLARAFKKDAAGRRRYTSIDRVVYLTVNLPSIAWGTDKDAFVWVTPLIDEDRPPDPDSPSARFLDRLYSEWVRYVSEIEGQPIETIEGAAPTDLKLRRSWHR